MTVENAIALVEQLLPEGRLTKVQEIVLRQSWAGQTYLEMLVTSKTLVMNCGDRSLKF